MYLKGPLVTSLVGDANGAGVPPTTNQNADMDQRRKNRPAQIAVMPNESATNPGTGITAYPVTQCPIRPSTRGIATRNTTAPAASDSILTDRLRAFPACLAIHATIFSIMVFSLPTGLRLFERLSHDRTCR